MWEWGMPQLVLNCVLKNSYAKKNSWIKDYRMKLITFLVATYSFGLYAVPQALRLIHEFSLVGADVQKIVVSRGGRYVLGMGTHTMKLWDSRDNSYSTRAIAYPENTLVDVAFGDSGAFYAYLVSGLMNKIVFVDIANGAKIDIMDGSVCSRIGDTSADCGSWKIWDGSLPTTFAMSSLLTNPYKVARIAVAFSDGNIQDWGIDEGVPVEMWESRISAPRTISFTRNGETIVAGSDGWSSRGFGASEVEVVLNPEMVYGHSIVLRDVTSDDLFYEIYQTKNGCSYRLLRMMPMPQYLAVLKPDALTKVWSETASPVSSCDVFQVGSHPRPPRFVPLRTSQAVLEIHTGDLVKVRDFSGGVVDEFRLISDVVAVEESGVAVERKVGTVAVTPAGTRQQLLAVARGAVISVYELP